MIEGEVLAGRYEVEALIARGGMAEVFRGRDQRLDRAVAIKVFRGVQTTDRQRFQAETRLLAGLQHPHLVGLYDGGDHEGTPFIVLELAESTTLADRLRDGALPPDDVAELGRGLSDALAYVHGEGIVHRDIKPSNVLIAAEGRILLGDFGIARLVDATQITATGTAVGTPAYLAPEQLRGDPVTPAADVYALGLLLLECLTGAVAFPGSRDEAALARLTRDPPVDQVRDPVWRSLLSEMTAREPGDRPSAGDVRARLGAQESGDGPATAVMPVASTEPAVEEVDRRPSAIPVKWLVAGSAAAALILLLVLVGLGLDDSSEPSSAPGTPVTTETRAVTTTAAPATAAPTSTEAPGPTTTTASTCEQLEAEKDSIEERKGALDEQYPDDKDTENRRRGELDDRKREIDQQLRDLDC